MTTKQAYDGFELQPIAGQWRRGGSSQQLTDSNPYSGDTLLQLQLASRDDVDAAYAAAAKAQQAWAARLPEERAAVLHRAVEIMLARAEEIQDWIVRESGSSRLKAIIEWDSARRITQESATFCNRVEGRILASAIPNQESRVYRAPLGVVGVISPWNFPYHLTARSIAPALALGNAVVLTPDTRTPVSGGFIIARVFEEAGLPKGVLQVRPGETAALLGPSGSGKSTLVRDILLPSLMQKIYKSKDAPGKHTAVDGVGKLDKVIDMDQSPIGRTPRSNAATYTGVFDNIRKLFAATPESKVRGYQPGRFSFNVAGGRCEACSGDGTIKIEMHFLPDVYVPCEVCKGARYNRDTLDITFKGKNIAEILDMPIGDAVEFFANQPRIARHMQTFVDVGLAYVRLGQSAPTLSGGEAQRVKLASELSKRSTGRTIYLLDEPTTGLHFEDVKKLLEVLHEWKVVFAFDDKTSDPASVAHFLAQHRPLPGYIALADAPFWSPAQAALLREEWAEDADWAEVVDQLNAALRA